MFIYLLIGIVYACDYQSFYANITDTNALIPLQKIKETLEQTRVIPDTVDLNNINLYTKVISSTFPSQGVVAFTLQLTISYTFLSGTFQSLGYAVMDNVTYTLQITEQFQQISTNFIPQNQFNFIGLQQYTNDYFQAVSSINSQVAQQLPQIYQSLTFTINPIPQTYTYTYTNFNEDQQSIIFSYQSNQINYTDNTLSLDGQLLIEDFDDNICQQMNLPATTASYNQVQLFSTSILESIIEYSYQQQYFNVLITNKWKSTDFQFYLGSFSNFLHGLSVFDPLTPVTGWCNVTDLPQYTTINITLNYQCDFTFDKNVNLLSVNMNLTLGLNFKQIEDTIQVLVVSINCTTKETYYEYRPRPQRDLAKLYIKSILNEHLLYRQVFGSGFKTIPRVNPNITLTNEYLILFEQ